MALTQISTAGVKDDAVTAGKIPANAVGSSELADNAVDNAAVASNAAIAGTKISPDFGSQNIVTTGNVGIGTTSPQSILSLKVSASRQLDVIKDSGDDHLVLKSTAPDASYNMRSIELAGSDVSFSTGASSGTSYTERMRVQTNGGISFNGDTAAANALDDYEEGYWSPTAVDGMTLHLQDSNNVPCRRYIKIGKQVTCWFDINWDSGNSSNSTTRFSGLPFSVETGGHQAAAAVTIGFFNGANDEGEGLMAHISSGLVTFFQNGDQVWSYSNSAGDRIAGFFTYTTT